MGGNWNETISALSALSPLVVAGGIAGIVMAVLGYLASTRNGGRAPAVPKEGQLSIGALIAETYSVDAAAKAVVELSNAATRLAKAAEFHAAHLEREVRVGQGLIDEVRELRRTIEDAVK